MLRVGIRNKVSPSLLIPQWTCRLSSSDAAEHDDPPFFGVSIVKANFGLWRGIFTVPVMFMVLENVPPEFYSIIYCLISASYSLEILPFSE